MANSYTNLIYLKKERFYIRKRRLLHRTGLLSVRCFIALGHQYGGYDVMWEHNIGIIGVQVFIGVGAGVACEICFHLRVWDVLNGRTRETQ